MEILTVQKYNDLQDLEYSKFAAKCKANNCQVLPFNRYFFKFEYKRGYVAFGGGQFGYLNTYYGKTKKGLINKLGL